MGVGLLIIDVQKDYFPGGKMQLVGSVEASEKIKNVIKIFRNNLKPIIHIKHISIKENASFFIPNTVGRGS